MSQDGVSGKNFSVVMSPTTQTRRLLSVSKNSEVTIIVYESGLKIMVLLSSPHFSSCFINHSAFPGFRFSPSRRVSESFQKYVSYIPHKEISESLVMLPRLSVERVRVIMSVAYDRFPRDKCLTSFFPAES